MTYTASMPLRFTLDRFLEANKITTYRLMKRLEGRVSRGTVYALAQGDVKRLDLESMFGVMEALSELTGKAITPNDLLEVMDDAPKQEN